MAYTFFDKLLDLAKKTKNNKDYIKDLVSLAKNTATSDLETGKKYCVKLKLFLGDLIKSGKGSEMPFWYDCYFQVLCIESRFSLDSYFQALEFDRPVKEKFYLPRRKQLLPIVRKLEDLLINNEIDELFLSQPARTGKTTLSMFVVSWLIGMDSEKSNLYASCSGQLINAFYKGIYEVITDNYTYQWWKIFPNVKFDKTSFCNAKETYLDTGRIKRYHSFTGRSIDADGLNGACDCNGLLIADDLVTGIEEALNPSRLQSLWGKVNNNLITRAKMGAKILWIGTRWSKSDPIGVRLNMLENDPKFKSRRFAEMNIPALNEKDESNFDYMFGLGFDTEYYIQRRSSFEATDDMASWLAQYMGEPIERSGLLFPMDSLKWFNGVLPKGKPDRKFSAVDVAWGGGDNLAMPIMYQYGNELYCVSWVFDKSDKFVTRPRVRDTIFQHKLGACQFEKNNGGDEYKEWVENALISEYKYKLNITSKSAPNNTAKEIRIFDKAPEIKQIFFLEKEKWDNDYRKAMTNLCGYAINAKNKNDDAPDVLAQVIEMSGKTKPITSYELFKRPL